MGCTTLRFGGIAALLVLAVAGWAPAASAAPANDPFANPQNLGSANLIAVDGTTTEATLEPGEEGWYGSPTMDGGSVWYRWTAPRDTRVWVDNCTADSNTWIGIYRGSDLQSLRYVQSYPGYSCGGSGIFGTRIEFRAAAGVTYRIRVFSDLYEDGAFRLRVNAPFLDGKLTQTASRRSIRRGGTVTYRIRARNVGDTAFDAKVLVYMAKPGTLFPMKNMGRYVSVRSSRGPCRLADFHFGAQPGAICKVGRLQPGESVLVTARAKPNRTISHSAQIDYLGTPVPADDARPQNNSPRKIRRTTIVRR